MAPVEQHDWASLLNQTQDLLQQDYHGYPSVQRDLQGLLQSSQSARARTSRARSLADQAAATRVLAAQGLDAVRLNQDVSMLDLQPGVEEVFHADTSSVEEYLGQVAEMTLLAAIQEVQQDAIASFERFLEECSTRDVVSDRAPSLLLGTRFGGGGDAGGAGGVLALGGAGGAAAAAPKVSAREAAYRTAVKRLNAALAAGERVSPVSEMAAACEGADGRERGALMAGCWALLRDTFAVVDEKGFGPASGAAYTDALLQGGRAHLQAGFLGHVRATISRHRVAAARGGDPDHIKDVQAYLSVKLRERGALDFQQAGGQDTSWVQVYVALRAGLTDAALRAAEAVADPPPARAAGATLRAHLATWLTGRDAFRAAHGAAYAREAERLLQGYSPKTAGLRSEYQILVTCLLAGDARTLDALSRVAPNTFTTIEDFMWVKLTLVTVRPGGAGASPGGGSIGSGSAGGPVYRLADLQAELSRWQPSYYSKGGTEPLLALTVMLLSLQWRPAIRYLAQDEATKAFRLEAVHLAAALLLAGALADPNPPAEGLDLSALLHGYGRQLVAADSETALQYYMLAADAAVLDGSAGAGGRAAVRGELLRELLVESRDYGTLLGAGGPLGSGGAIATFARSTAERQQLLGYVASACQMAGQPNEARELFMAAGRPAAALRIVNEQLSAALGARRGAGSGAAASAQVDELVARGQAAVGVLGPAPGDEAARREADAFGSLLAVKQLMDAAAAGNPMLVLSLVAKLPFIPQDRDRVPMCAADTRQLPDPVKERLSDVVGAYADALVAARSAPGAAMPELLASRAAALKVYALQLDQSHPPELFLRVNACVRQFG